jgi:hypothetical protein
VSFDLDTCKWVIWGAKPPQDTFGYIHQAFFRALKFLGKEVLWFDDRDDVSQIDFSNSLFMALACNMSGLPKRKDCFYFIHNALGTPYAEYFDGLRVLHYGLYVSTNTLSSEVAEVAPEMFYNPSGSSLVFRWGTDLLPHEIEANKPARTFNSESYVCNFVGTAIPELAPFRRACEESGRDFKIYSRVSVEENVRLIQAAYMAPTINIQYQTQVGYIPCRIFKNISYGQMGITNNKAVQDFFRGRLIYNEDSYKLFYDAKDQLPTTPLSVLHGLMDEVAAKYTYLNKIDGIVRTIRNMESQ